MAGMRRLNYSLFLLLLAATANAELRVPAYVLQLPESVENLFVADAKDARIYHFTNQEGRVRLAGHSYFSVGERGIGKRRAWDRRTPLGVYFVVDRLDTTRLHEKYGIMAFPLDYPNARDRQAGRTGDGIWVHGVEEGIGQRPRRDTDGCLALPNEDLAAFEAYFEPGSTPVIVTREMRWANAGSLELIASELRQYIELWRSTMAEANTPAHLSLYQESFRYRGLVLDDWRTVRQDAIDSTGPVEIIADDVLVLADPQEAGLYITRFAMTTVAENSRRRTVKRLYWRRNADGAFGIVAEDNG